MGILPVVGFIPKLPHKEAGILIEPPPSLPCEKGVIPAATDAEAPPLDPPEILVISQGFTQSSPRKFSVAAIIPNSGRLVFPRLIEPPDFKR